MPQRRKRIFVFGARNASRGIPEPQPTHSSDPEKNLLPYTGVRDSLLPFDLPLFFEPTEQVDGGTYEEELRHVPPGSNYIALAKLDNYRGRTFSPGSRFWNFLYKLHPEQPSITIAAQPGPWVGPFHWSNRRLRAPEAAAIQTFPENYLFYGSRRSVQRQIGNAVPCLLGRAMVQSLLNGIQN